MEAHPRQLTRVFRGDLRLVVPLFQRPYVWNVADQWLPLWQDIRATEHRFAVGDTTPHFLGAVVLQEKPTGRGAIEVREVIDGQQRLTTLQLFVTAVRDVAADLLGEHRLVRRLTGLVRNDDDVIDEPVEAFKLWPTNTDRAAYRAVLTGDHRTTDYSAALPRVVQAYTWFRRHITDWIGERPRDEAEDCLRRLGDVVETGLVTVVIDLTAEDDAQVIFETLNARGTPLLASDLIKNLLFRTLESSGHPIEILYGRYWQPLEDDAWSGQVRQGRLTRPRLDAFMHYFLITFLQEEVQAHELFSAVRRFVANQPEHALQVLDGLGTYSKVYLDIDGQTAGSLDEQASLERMQIADTQTVTPLLMWLFAHSEGAERARAVAALESFVGRRAVCGWSTANYNRIFLELLRRLGTGERPVDDVVSNHLAGLTSGSGLWPTDRDVMSELADRQVYRRIKRDRLALLLQALEASATTGRTEPLVLDGKVTVEHLLPQRWHANWHLPDDPAQAQRLHDERDALLHTLGNLTLVTGSLNSTMSNAPWSTKRAHLLAYSALTLNRSLPTVWDVHTIRARTAELSVAICRLWPRPATTSSLDAMAIDSERANADELVVADADDAAKSSSQGRIGDHISHVFDSRRSGEFLTIAQISKTPSPAYPEAPPSQGAISARLFPKGRPTTLKGVVPDRQHGIRGARKV